MAKQVDYEAREIRDEEDVAAHIIFSPPVSQQRHQAVLSIVRECKVKRIIDYGCNNCQFIKLLRQEKVVESIVGVDIDRAVLEFQSNKLEPLAADYLALRPLPLKIQLYEGCISEYDDRLGNVDMVTMVEVVEHLLPDILDKFPKNIFGKLQPKIVVITTPNADFNVLFRRLNYGEFRHWDHKFEWTREQFQNWCENIKKEYNYKVKYSGIGKGPEGTEMLGCCSQMAVFTQNSVEDEPLSVALSSLAINPNSLTRPLNSSTEPLVSFGENHPNYKPRPYKLVKECVYPHFNEPKYLKERISKILLGIAENIKSFMKRNEKEMPKFSFQYPLKNEQKHPESCRNFPMKIPDQFCDSEDDKTYTSVNGFTPRNLPQLPMKLWVTTYVKFLQDEYLLHHKEQVLPGQFDDAVEDDVNHSNMLNSVMFNLRCSEMLSGDAVVSEDEHAFKIEIPIAVTWKFMALVGEKVSREELIEVIKWTEDIHFKSETDTVLFHVEKFLEDNGADFSADERFSDKEDLLVTDEQTSDVYSAVEFMEESWD